MTTSPTKVSVLICLGGELGTIPADERGPFDAVIAADSGVRHAHSLGLQVDCIVGDLDSASPDDIAAARNYGARIVEFPSHKDVTDFEIALLEVSQMNCEEVTILGGGGGRIDHLLGNMAAMAAPVHAHLRRHFRTEHAWISVLDDAAITLNGSAGDTVSLIPLGGPVSHVTTTGLKYPLSAQAMSPYAALGVSNEMIGTSATVTASGGVLLAVHPQRARYI